MTIGLAPEIDLTTVLAPELAARTVATVSARARRVSLRLDPANGVVVLVRPRRASLKTVMDFVAARADWIRTHLATLPPRIALEDGVVLPISGVDHVVRAAPKARGGVWREGESLMVAGEPAFTNRRIKDWLKKEARRTLAPMVHAMAATIDEQVTRVTVRDTRSRWGSCSADGALSFSWRLILAPPHVLTYVAAHEVAHLRHMNHSRAFWRTVDMILDTYVTDSVVRRNTDLARDWLRLAGVGLHRYG